MVERTTALDAVFASLSDPTRRDILRRVSRRSMSVSEIAGHYPVSLAAVAKHLTVLERARLIEKTRRGKEQIVTIAPKPLAAASEYLDRYRELWEKRLDALDRYLRNIQRKGK